MKRTKKPLRLLCWLVILLLTLILSGCSLLSEPAQTTPATETPITDKTGTTDATETTAKNNEAEIVSAEGFILEGTSLSLTVPNATESLSFSERITVSDGARWQVFSDPQGQNVIRTKTVVLEPGDNPFYLLVVSGDGKNIALYTVTIRRKPIYTVAFDTDGGTAIAPITVEEDATPSAPTAVPARTGYVFGGWDNDFSAPVTGDLTVKASWTVIDYAITYNLNGGTNAQTNPVTYTVEDAVALAEPTRLGYSFAGWSDNGAIAAGSTGEKAFTASWTAIDYPITYTLNGGTNNEQNPATYTVEGAVVLAEPKRDGYTFLGWSDGGVIAAGSTGEKTFTANWMAETDTPYTVEYYLENLTGDGYDKTLTEPKGGTTDTTVTAEQKIFAHFTFLPDESVSEGTIAGDGSLILKMYYSRDTYTVTFAPNGGALTDGVAAQTVRYGNAAAIPTFARKGYSFAGWDDDAGCTAVESDLTVTALWTVIDYTINYTLNGGTNNENNPATYTVEDEITLATPTRTGYTFAGWSDDGVIAVGSTGVKTFTANWTAIRYPINYHLNGGTNAENNPATYTIEDAIELAAPKRTGYTFEGWTNDGTIAVGSTGEKTFSASWTAIDYTITYTLNGGTNAQSNPATYTIEDAVNLATPTRKGYTFAGWSDGGSIAAGSTGEKTFTASWTVINYAISYELNGGTNAQNNPATYTVEDEINLAAPTRTGYTFAGWSNGGAIAAGSTGEKTFTASWTAINYPITYNLGGGTNAQNNPATYTITDAINLAAPTRPGYTFAGWSDDGVIAAGSTGEKTFTASWTVVRYPVTYVLNEGTNAPGNPTTYTIEDDEINLAAPTRTGYTFAGWSNGGVIAAGSTGEKTFTANWMSDTDTPYTVEYYLENLTGDGYDKTLTEPKGGTTDTTVTAEQKIFAHFTFLSDKSVSEGTIAGDGSLVLKMYYSRDTYTVTFAPNGGALTDGSASQTVRYGNPAVFPTFVRSDYAFAGWDDDAGCAAVESDLTVTALWTPIDYPITYTLNGGTNNENNPATYTIEDDEINLAAPTRTGYTFAGWSNGGVIAAGSTGEKTFSASWTVIDYTINYTLNGGTNNENNPATYTVEDEITLATPTRLGYTFAGWTDNGVIAVGSTGEKTFTASWTVIRYPIVYNLGDGTNAESNPATYTVEDEITLATPTRTGYSFAGWSNGGSIAAGSTGEKTFTASWTAINYPITYTLNGGTNAQSNPATYTIEDAVNLATPTRKGYTFAGWSNGGSIAAGSTGEKTFTASWTVINYTVSYELNGGTNAQNNPATYTVEDEINLAAPTRTGYTFAGWSNGGAIAAGSTGEKTFTASWTAINYPITYNLGGGTNAPGNPATYTITDAINLAAPTRPGYTFAGWSNGGSITAGSTGEKTFTASWTIVRYPIIYILNGGTNAQNNPASYTVEDAVNLAAPIRAGYTFAGWSNGGTITVGSTGQKTFTASWVQSFPAPSEPEYDAEYEAVISAGKTQMGASEVFAPSRAGVVYTNPLPAPASLDTAASREELIEIANYYAFYRAGGFTVTLGYPADDAEVELTYLYRYSCFIPSICSVSGTLENRTLTVRLKFYPESYLVNPRTTVPAQILGGENDPPNGTDTLPGLDPVNGISVWDSEQACYCLSHGYKIAPIAGSPAEAIINAARTALAEIVDDSMTEWQIVYRVYRWLLEHSEYDYAGDEWSSYSFDKANESEMLPARVISFFAEGPILYGQGVCFGYAKAGELLLGLEGIELRRVVAFHWKIWDYTPVGRNWNILYDYGYGSEINVHSYLYLKIDGYDYIFDPSFAKNGKKSVLDQTTGQNVQILTMKDFAIGLTKSEHSTFYSEFPYDLVTESGNYNPGSYRYLSTVTYDGTHDLLLSSTAEAQHYYNFLLSTVFSGASDFRTVTLFYEADYSTWKSKYKQALLDFLNATNVPYKYTDASVSPTRTGANVMVTVVFGKRDDSYTPNVYAPAYDATYENKIAEGKSYLNASEIETPSRVGLTYPRKLPLSCSSDRAETRAELIEIANWHAFYREGTFSVTLGYEATDAETELNLLYRNSGFLPSLCALSGSLNGAVLTVNLKFYPETYLVVPPTAIAAACDGVILDPPAGAETFPGLDPVNGISVWDSEQAVYCLSHGYKIAPIAGSPAASIVETACGILSQISDDSLTEWEIVYRVFLWIMNHAVYDTDGEGWVYNSLDKDNEPDMISARMISFKAEGPLLYGVAACFGYAKASALLLGLEGIELRRVVAFDNGRIGAETDSRTYIKPNPNQAGSYYILVHSYLYLHIDGYDYIFDPTASGAGQRSVADRVGGGNASVRILRDFCLGMSYTEHRKIYNNYSPDPFAASDEYRPAMYNYLTELKYDGTHDLLISSTAEAQQYYTHLLNTVFSGEPAFRSITIFYDGMSLSTWKSQYRSALESFLNETGVPFSYTYSDISTKRTVADVMVQIAFGK